MKKTQIKTLLFNPSIHKTIEENIKKYIYKKTKKIFFELNKKNLKNILH
jgi:hypothetical protein